MEINFELINCEYFIEFKESKKEICVSPLPYGFFYLFKPSSELLLSVFLFVAGMPSRAHTNYVVIGANKLALNATLLCGDWGKILCKIRKRLICLPFCLKF